MKRVLKDISEAIFSNKKLLVVLIDPEKFQAGSAESFLRKIPGAVTHLFIGGSTVTSEQMEACISEIKLATNLPLVLFPGDHSQISEAADALLFLSLLSGRNPEYLIGQQIKSVGKLRNSSLEIIPTGYILIDGGKESAVQRVSQTQPMSQKDPEAIVETALAGKFSGKKLIYLEAGSGAEKPVAPEIISAVKEAVQLPVIVGGGIRSEEQLQRAYEAGADMLVVGTAFENENFGLQKSLAEFQDQE